MSRTEEIRLLKYAVRGARAKLRHFKQQHKKTQSPYFEDKMKVTRRDISIYAQRLNDLRGAQR